ncbi:MAG: lamin tail domain-containing protein [Nitrosopumilus sp.]|nr:lamin tail domain-containing protein [Nitrosopumilus sp.]
MNGNLTLVFSVLLFAGILVPAYAASADHIVINEVDINPPGDDSKSVSEWVEIYNPTDSDVDLSGWKIASTTILKKTMTLQPGTVIKSGQFLTYSYQSLWFTDSNESVELRDDNGIVIDKTPLFADIKNDFTSWQRLYDGYDSDSSNDWKFVTSTAGSSNGKLATSQDSKEITVTASSDKDSYLFGETATISGSVSEQVFIVKPFFQPQQIVMTISGPNFNKILTMYPDLNLNYKTTVKLDKVLGINEGLYYVSVTYAGTSVDTGFSVGFESSTAVEKTYGSVSITADSPQYIPGQLASIIGHASKIIPYEGMKLVVKDPNNKIISEGNLYPTNGEFKTTVFISTVNTVYGTYEIYAEYFDQSSTAFFDVVKDVKEDTPISIWTDKPAYGLGDTVKINGRLNQQWVSTLDLEILQTKQLSIGSSSAGSDSGFKISDGVRILGDGSFVYTFTIPDSEIRLGDYRISVSKSLGAASTIIHVVSNPDDYVASDAPLTVYSDKESYESGDKMAIRGFIKNPSGNSSYLTGTPVKISISHEDGTPLKITALSGPQTKYSDNVAVAYVFTAITETSGNYLLNLDVTKSVFTAGKYVITSQYLEHAATSTFSVTDALDLKDGPIISIDKDVYGLGETVYLTGIVPPTGDNSVTISITNPDGTGSKSGATVDNQRFSWSWVAPISEKVQNVKIDDGKSVTKSNFGLYKIKISVPSYSKDIFFKVSPDPENDSLSTTPIFVSTEKSLYKAGEKLKVVGNIIKRVQGSEGLVVPERVTIKVLDGTFPFKQIHESSVYPTQGGEFTSLFELPITIFSEGTYSVKAIYSNTQANTIFGVVNDFTFGIDGPVSLLLSTDKSEYHPGDVVVIDGKPNKLIYLENFDVSVIKKVENEINCGSFYCGSDTGKVTTIRPSPSGSFSHLVVIPDSTSSIGTYQVTVDADFETKSILFNVVEKPLIIKPNIVIEKENRLSESIVSITTGEKISDDATIAPRVLSGSLVTPIRGDESLVNLKVSTSSGICIIGPDADCLVRESTRKQGQIYDVVEVDGISLNVRYSGPDVRLEKFSILPESSTTFLPDTDWNVEVIKDDQISRFYYTVTYKTLE